MMSLRNPMLLWNILLAVCMGTCSVGGEEIVNLALHRPYTISPEPRYPITLDADDTVQLTDGKHATGDYLWIDRTSVGWSNLSEPVVVTIDQGKVRSIGGAAFSTAGGRASVSFPFAIYVLTSDDGESFYLAGELIHASAHNGLPSPIGYKKHTYRNHEMATHGRYVRFVVVPSGPYVMCDEIEVYAANLDHIQQRVGERVADAKQLIERWKLTTIVKGRLVHDLLALERLPGYSRPDSLWREVSRLPVVERIDWRRGVPYNDLHRRIWATHAPWARRQFKDKPPLLVWPANPWDPLKPFDLPPHSSLKTFDLKVTMLRREFRSAVVNLTNLSDESVRVKLSCAMKPVLPTSSLSIRDVIFVECQDRDIVANALPDASREGDDWVIEVPAGATKQAWLMFNSRDVEAGSYRGELRVRCDDLSFTREVPLDLTVAPLTMPARPTLTTTTWDYAHPGGQIRYEQTWRAAVQQMRDHFITAPWLSPHISPWPRTDNGTLDAQGNIVGQLDWSRIDAWIEAWPDATCYLYYMGEFNKLPETGIPLSDPRAQRALHQFIEQFLDRFAKRGIPASKVAFMTRDEPYTDEKERSIIQWAGLLKKINPDVQIFNDPIRDDPTQAVSSLYEVTDILCPNLQKYFGEKGENRKAVDFYQAQRRSGKTLWTYQCSGPVKQLDPYHYFRLQAWYAFREGMTGSGFWALADDRHKPFGKVGSWNDFALTGETYSIIYWDENGVTDSKQLEAIREGIEDYEYLVMLRKAIAEAKGGEVARAQAVLDGAVAKAAGDYSSGRIHWRGDTDRSVADKVRLQILGEILRLQGAQ